MRPTADAATEARLDRLFHALADSTRREILRLTATESRRVTDLAEPFAMSLNAVSKHIKVLEEVGLLSRTIDGRVHRCRLNAQPLADVAAVVAYYRRFWEHQLDQLDRTLEEMEPPCPE